MSSTVLNIRLRPTSSIPTHSRRLCTDPSAIYPYCSAYSPIPEPVTSLQLFLSSFDGQFVTNPEANAPLYLEIEGNIQYISANINEGLALWLRTCIATVHFLFYVLVYCYSMDVAVSLYYFVSDMFQITSSTSMTSVL